MGAATDASTGPSRAFQRTWAALAAWNPVPVTPTSWPALALMVERFTTGPDTHAHAAEAMRSPAAAVVTPPIAHLRTCFILTLPPWLKCCGVRAVLGTKIRGKHGSSRRKPGRNDETPRPRLLHCIGQMSPLNRCIS